MPLIASGPSTQGLMGFETVPGVLPATPPAYKLPVSNLQLSPNVPDFTDDAMDGTTEPREWVAGKFGADGSFDLTGSRDSYGPMLKALFGPPVTYGATGSYDHYFTLSSTLAPSFFFEQGHLDIGKYLLFLGNQASSWQQACTFQGLAKSTWGVVGLSMVPFASSQISGTITDVTGSRAMNYITATLKEGGTTLAYFKTINWNIDLHLQREGAMDGTPYGYAITRQSLASMNLDATAHFLDTTLIAKGIAGTETSIEVDVPAVESGHGLHVWFPTGKYKPFGIAAAGATSLEQRLTGMFYRNAASLVGAEAVSKYFTTVTITGGTNDSLVIAMNGGANQTFTLTAGSRTPANIVTDLSALTGGTAAVENGRVVIRSSTSGPTGSVQIIAASTADTPLGFHNTLVPGFRTACLVRLTNAVASYA